MQYWMCLIILQLYILKYICQWTTVHFYAVLKSKKCIWEEEEMHTARHLYLKPKHFKVSQSLKSYQISFMFKEIEYSYGGLIYPLFWQLFPFFTSILTTLLCLTYSFTYYLSFPHCQPTQKTKWNKQTNTKKLDTPCGLFPFSPFLYCLTFLRSWNNPNLNVTSPESIQSRWTVNIYEVNEWIVSTAHKFPPIILFSVNGIGICSSFAEKILGFLLIQTFI